jgi:glycine cleavage system H protein
MAEIHFTRTHEWIQDAADEATIGITDHAQQLLGDMVYVEMPQVGAIVQAGVELGVVESVKAASDFYAPVSGVVTAINEAVSDNPALVNEDPYGAGWLIKIRPGNREEWRDLLTENEYHNELIGED